jgi:hypothetical protein
MSNFDPKLKAAMREIEKILVKYDCGGFVNLASKTHGEFKLIQPSWSLYRDVGNKKAHMKLYTKSLLQQTEETLHFLLSTRDTCGMMFMKLDYVYKQLASHAEIEHVFKPEFDTD